MKQILKSIKGKHLTALLVLFTFVLYCVSLTLNTSLRTKHPVSAAEEVTVSEAEPVSKEKAREILNYLIKLDTNQGRADFQEYLSDLQLQKERLTLVRNNLSYNIAKQFRFESLASNVLNVDLIDLEPLHEAAPGEESTVSDLMDRIEREIYFQQLILRNIESINNVITLLKNSSIFDEKERVQKKLEMENELIGLLEAEGQDSLYPLLSELLLENNLTRFLSLYIDNGVTLIDQLEDYASLDLSIISDKLEKEQSILLILDELYPEDSDKETTLDEISDNLLSLYFEVDVDEKISLFVNCLLQSENILTRLNADSLEISDDLTQQTTYLENLLGSLKSEESFDDYKDEAGLYYEYLADKNDGELKTNFSFNSHYEVLNAFNNLINFTNPLSLSEDIENFKELYPYVTGLNDTLSQKFSDLLEKLAAEEAAAEEISEEAVTETGTETTEESADETAVEEPIEEVTTETIDETAEFTTTETPSDNTEEVTATEADTAETSVIEESIDETAEVTEEQVTEESAITTTEDKTDNKEKPKTPKDNAQASDDKGNLKKVAPAEEPIEELRRSPQDSTVRRLRGVTDSLGESFGPTEEPIEEVTTTETPLDDTEEVTDAEADTTTETVVVEESTDETAEVTEEATEELTTTETPSEDIEEVTTDEQVTEESVVDTAEDKKDKDKEETVTVEVEDVVETSEEEAEEEIIELTEDPSTLILEPIIQEEVALKTPAVSIEKAQAPQITDIIGLFQGEENILDDVILINQIIANDPDIIKVDEAIAKLDEIEKFALITQTLINSTIASQIDLDSFVIILENQNLTADEIDTLVSFLNQLSVELGYIDEALEFSGVNGVIRFDEVSCPDLSTWQSFDPETADENEEGYVLLRLYRYLNVDFCVGQSTDITTKNIVNKPSYTKKITDEYKLNQEGLNVRFLNNVTRDVEFSINDGNTAVSDKLITLNHKSELTIEESVASAVTEAVSDAIKETIKEDLGVDVVESDDEQSVSEAVEEVLGPLNKYTMSALENPDFLFTPLTSYQKQDFEQIIVYESGDHRKNIVDISADDAYKITPKLFNEYTIFNFGDGKEEYEISFENTVLHEREDGAIEGYYVSDADQAEEIYNSGKDSEAEFVISIPFALNKDSELIEKQSYKIAGDDYNKLLFTLSADTEDYPIVLDTELTFINEGQTYYDAVYDYSSKGSFGTSQAIGDFNGDGFDDLAVSSPDTGQVLVYFYDKNSTFSGQEPDLVLKGGNLSSFVFSLAIGDINKDGISDLIAGDPSYNENTGRVWILYGRKGSKKNTEILSSDADIIIHGAGKSDEFGYALLSSDLDGDGKDDLAVSSPGDLNAQGVVHIFYNETLLDSQKSKSPNPQKSKTEILLATDADVNITGEVQDGAGFGMALTAGDFDSDGTYDLTVSAPSYDSSDSADAGRIYMFLQDSVPWTDQDTDCGKNCRAANADKIIEGMGKFGTSLIASDFDGDGKDDLAAGAPEFELGNGTGEGRICMFYQNDIPWTLLDEECDLCEAENADVKITGGGGENLGLNLLSPDFNDDGENDLAAGSYKYDHERGIVYLFYADKTSLEESISTRGFLDADDADIKWEGEYLSDFGYSIASGDLNADGTDDISVGAPRYADYHGRTYLFYSEKEAEVIQEEVQAEVQEETVKKGEKIKPIEEPIEESIEEPIEEEEEVTEELEITPEEIEEAIEEVKESAEEYLIDISVPDTPVVTCQGFTDGGYTSQGYASCSWTDTAGPSEGTYKYCFDNKDECIPDTEKPERTVDLINLSGHYNYLRTQTSDEGGDSDIASFHLAIDTLPVFTDGPSDGGSDELKPTREGAKIQFTGTGTDIEGDDYYLIVCRTNDKPVFTDGVPQCLGGDENLYCLSKLTKSGKPVSCSYDTSEESSKSSIWYAFLCEQFEDQEKCTDGQIGSGPAGSPFYIKHPAQHGEVDITDSNRDTIEPGERLKFTLSSTNITNVPEGSLVTMYVCTDLTTGFDYNKNECIGGDLICASQPTDTSSDVTCNEPSDINIIVPVPSEASQDHVHIYVEHGERGLVDGDHIQAYDITDVRPTLISYTNTGEIIIPAGGSTDIEFSAIIEDLNGWADIESVEGVFFDSDTVWNDCSENNNDCYIDDECELTQINGKQVKAECSAELFYNANESKYWKAHINPVDSKGKYMDLGDSESSRTVPALTAINQEEITIPYKLTLPGKISEAVEVILTNLGNQQVDVLINGTDLVGDEGTLPKELQKWDTDPEFDYEKEGHPLVESATGGGSQDEGCADVTLKVHDDSSEDQSVSVYWKIKIPENQKADIYSGTVSFTPAPDTCSE